MINRITGKLKEKRADSVIVDVGGIHYEVLIPPSIIMAIDSSCVINANIELVIFHYHQLEPSRSIPVMIGFLNEIEKEFFEKFITVSGVGPKAAVRALIKPISHIAYAIDNGDMSLLKSLPGIGTQRAREIVAKLQGKVGKFGLIKDDIYSQEKITSNIEEEALAVLIQLQYKNQEAKNMIAKALQRNPDIKNSEELLNEVYRQKGN